MVSGEGSMQCQLGGCQDRPVLKCPRRGKGRGLVWDVGRKDNWHRTCSQRWPSWVPMFVLSVRVQRGPLTWPKSFYERIWKWDRDEASCPKVLHRMRQLAGFGPAAAFAVDVLGMQGNRGSWYITLQGEEHNRSIKCVDSHPMLPCQPCLRKGWD